MRKRLCSKWVEKYRPRHVRDVILPKQYRDFFFQVLNAKKCPNLLFYGEKGRGKTTLALALIRDLEARALKINASLDGKMDTLRDEISAFSRTATCGVPRIVLLDEFDSVPAKFQAALRGLMEETGDTCSFILTCNYKNKIIDALREGRTMEFDFDFKDVSSRAEMIQAVESMVCAILRNEHMEYSRDAVHLLVDKMFPSIREILSVVQKSCLKKGGFAAPETETDVSKIQELIWDRLSSGDFQKYLETFEILRSMPCVGSDAYDFLQNFAIQRSKAYSGESQSTFAKALLKIAEYEKSSLHSSLPDLQLRACLCDVGEMFSNLRRGKLLS